MSFRTTALLFGNVLAVDSGTVWVLLGLGLISITVLAVISRPLLFASLQPELAEAKGVSLRLYSVLFLAVVALATAETDMKTAEQKLQDAAAKAAQLSTFATDAIKGTAAVDANKLAADAAAARARRTRAPTPAPGCARRAARTPERPRSRCARAASP